MGPIQRELRRGARVRRKNLSSWLWNEMTMDAFLVCLHARKSLGLRSLDHVQTLPDVLSEAIEAAGALGL